MNPTEPILESSPPSPISGASTDGSSSGSTPSAPKLSLIDFLDVDTLQEVQDSFTAVTRLITTIRDADGKALTDPTDAQVRAMSDELLEQLLAGEAMAEGRFVAPIVVEGQEIGSITVESPTDASGNADSDADAPNPAAAVQFLYLLANSIARLCFDEYHTRQRVQELSVLYRVSTAISVHRNLQVVLDTAAEAVAEVMQVKAVSIRLFQAANDELVPRAVFNLSDTYLNKGTIRREDSPMFQEALAGEVVYIADMGHDSRVLFPGDAAREGLVSMLCTGMRFQGRPIGTIQLFSGELRRFTDFEVQLLQAISQLLAAAIENTRLDQQRAESQRVMRQLQLGADVQKRLLPSSMPKIPPFELAARYVPSFELGGDFYDFINLDGNLGIGIGDVVGKGVGASLLMASVRASLRAYAQDVYDLDEVISRVNVALCRDTLDNEFATLWYGVLDPRTLRLTYCNAGHEPPLLLREGRIYRLDVGGMIVGVDRSQHYHKGLWDLQPGDLILLYTDGLTEAMDGEQRKFGRKRIDKALLEAADKPPAQIIQHILAEMRHFTGMRRSIDDTSLVVLKVGHG